MAWFKDKIDDRTKAMAADVAAAYMERSRLAYQLWAIQPRVTDIEIAVLWAGLARATEQSRAEKAKSEMTEGYYDVTPDFLDSFCRSYIEDVLQSSLKLRGQCHAVNGAR